MQYKFQIDNKEKFKLKLLKYQAELKAKIVKLKEEIAFLNEKETKFNAIPPGEVKFENNKNNSNCSNCHEIQLIIGKKDLELKIVTEKGEEFVNETMRKIQDLSADFEQKILDLKDSLSISEAKCEKYELKLAEVVKSFMDEVKNFSNESAECQSQLAALQSEMKVWKLNNKCEEEKNFVKPKSDSKTTEDSISDVLTDVIITKDAEIESFKLENSFIITENVRMKIKLDALLIETDTLKKNYEKFMLQCK